MLQPDNLQTPAIDPGSEFAQGLHQGFLRSANRFPQRFALEVDGRSWTYSELRDYAFSIAATLNGHSSPVPRFTAVYATRTAVAYAGILAALLRGHAYVPLNPRFPAARTRQFLKKTGAQSLIVDQVGESSLNEILSGAPAGLVVLLPERSDVGDLQRDWPDFHFLGTGALSREAGFQPANALPGETAYVLFTSGSTGEPKGVAISHRSIAHQLHTMVHRYSLNETDRISQFADLTFDPSVFDVFAPWECGACVCCPETKVMLNPAPYLAEQRITVFQTVPSNGLLMRRLGALKADRFPHLRVTLFGGEALPMELCRAWRVAAPNSIIENLYGPTEMTINSTAYRWDDDSSPSECQKGVVPIGQLLPGVTGRVVDENLRDVPDGDKGEFLLAGPQQTTGYLNDPEKTVRALVVPPGASDVYYRTGDLVTKINSSQAYFFHGRVDFQIKVFGLRIELGEIEAALRTATGTQEVAAVGWPITETGVGGIVGFIAQTSLNPEEVRDSVRKLLPQQMVPREIVLLNNLPLNTNGKVDRGALKNYLASRTP